VKRLVPLFLCVMLHAAGWNRIDILCVIRDAQGRPVTNVTKDRVQLLAAGEPRRILEFSRATDQPQIETITLGPNVYQDAYQAIMRKFSDPTRRKILVIEEKLSPGSLTPLPLVWRWELIFLAERRGVIIYVLSHSDRLQPLADLAEETGGSVVLSERALQAELAAQYRIVAEPPHDPGTGAYNTLEVRADGLRAQAPHNLYITPPWEVQP
jgi:hypothetical protein